jgi:hypothetical protein
MFKLLNSLLLCLFLLSCREGVEVVVNSKVVENNSNSDPYNFDTIMSNGYYLNYKEGLLTNNQEMIMKRLTLMHNDIEISIVSEVQREHKHIHLGYIRAEFDHEFLFTYSGGGQSQLIFDLIDKETGAFIIHGNLISHLEDSNTKDYFIYEGDDNGGNIKNDYVQRCFIYDVNKRDRIEIELPEDLDEEYEYDLYYNCLQIIKVENGILTTEYMTNKGEIKEVEYLLE